MFFLSNHPWAILRKHIPWFLTSSNHWRWMWASVSSPDPDPGCGNPFQMAEINGENHLITTYPPSPGMIHHPSWIHPWRLTCNMSSWRFGSDHFPCFSWVICRFQALIFQGVPSKSSKHLRLSMVWPVALMPCKPSPMPTPSRYPG